MGGSAFDVSCLAGIRSVPITAPPHARITGADKLGAASRILERQA